MQIKKTFKFRVPFSYGSSAFCGISTVFIREGVPNISEICKDAGVKSGCLIVCDTNTAAIAKQISANSGCPICVLPSGEANKGWASCEAVLKACCDSHLNRGSLLLGVGGGVITDLAAFCASIYMRGIKCALVSTTLLGMVDASFGGKTGFDLFGIKNIVGTFYPAFCVYMCTQTLESLDERQWKSGMAELIKTAVLDGSAYKKNVRDSLLNVMVGGTAPLSSKPSASTPPPARNGSMLNASSVYSAASGLISRAVFFKAKVVADDPTETRGKRALLNLGHTFGHALESVCGLGKITHGEAVAWGIVCACKIGVKLGVTELKDSEVICSLISDAGYDTKILSFGKYSSEAFMQALLHDKKNKDRTINFILPAKHGALIYPLKENELHIIKSLLEEGEV